MEGYKRVFHAHTGAIFSGAGATLALAISDCNAYWAQEVAKLEQHLAAATVAKPVEKAKEFDPKKLMQTRDGRKVRILCTDGPSQHYPVIGLIDGQMIATCWSIDGFITAAGITLGSDLVNVEPVRAQREAWMNAYEDGTHWFHPTREYADRTAADHRTACVHITWADGEGLEEQCADKD